MRRKMWCKPFWWRQMLYPQNKGAVLSKTFLPKFYWFLSMLHNSFHNWQTFNQMWKWFVCLLTTCIVQATDEGAITTYKAYYLRNQFEQVGCPTEQGYNPLNAELNPICHLLALLWGATIVVVSRLRVKGIMDREQHSSGNTEHNWTFGWSHNRMYKLAHGRQCYIGSLIISKVM